MEASAEKVSIIGLDIAKSVFQAHGADASGGVVFRKKITRARLLEFFASLPPCTVAMEACGGAHHWAREMAKLGHEVKLIAPKYVKPFVKRQKNDAADAEAICEAASRPTMRFVAVKSETTQASGLVFRTRDILVRQRTQIINAVRGHLAEYGLVVPQGAGHFKKLVAYLEDPADLPQDFRTERSASITAFGRSPATLDHRRMTKVNRFNRIATFRITETLGPFAAGRVAARKHPNPGSVVTVLASQR